MKSFRSIKDSEQGIGLSRREEVRLFDISAKRNAICFKTVHNAARTLVVLELRRCNLLHCEFLLECLSLRYCYLPENSISMLPILSSLQQLQFLNFEVNSFDNQQQVANLRYLPKSLLYLSFKDNMITTATHYRVMILKTVLKSGCKIMCLDDFVVCDEELFVLTQARPMNLKPFLIPQPKYHVSPKILRLSSSLESIISFSETLKQLNLRESCLRRFHASFSPILKFQLTVRQYLRIKSFFRVARIVPKLQAACRRRFHVRRMEHELIRVLEEFDRMDLAVPKTFKFFSNDSNMQTNAMVIIAAFLKRLIGYYRCKWAGLRIVKWTKKMLAHRQSVIAYIKARNVGGLLFPVREKDRVLACIAKLQAQYKYLNKLSSNSNATGKLESKGNDSNNNNNAATIKPARARFADDAPEPDVASISPTDAQLKTALQSLQAETAIISLPFLKLHTMGGGCTDDWAPSYLLYNRSYSSSSLAAHTQIPSAPSASPLLSARSSKGFNTSTHKHGQPQPVQYSLSYLYKPKVTMTVKEKPTRAPFLKQKSAKM
jgi:hypothetical protein